jgi:hypothetical protein
MDKFSGTTPRTDKLKATLLLFENTTCETKLSDLCKELVSIINVGGEGERNEIFSGEENKFQLSFCYCYVFFGYSIL